MKKSKGFSCWDAMRLIGKSLLGLDFLYLASSSSAKSPIQFHFWIAIALMSFSFLFLFFSTKKIIE